MVKREKIEKSEIKIIVTLDNKKWEDAQKKAFHELHENLEIPGFRKGKVPLDKAKSQITEQQIFQQAIKLVFPDMGKEASEELKKEDKVIAGPFYQIISVTKTELVAGFTYTIYPTIELPNYKGLNIKYTLPKVEDKEVEEELKRVQERLSVWNHVTEPIKKGLKVKFDFEGFIDNVPFQGGKAKNYELIIGSNQFIPGFEDGMLGMLVDEEKKIKVRFPKEYHDSKLADKDAIFKVKVHSIMKKAVPVFDNTLAVEANVPGVSSMEELSEYIRNAIYETKQMNNRMQFRQEAFSKILKDAKIEIPNTLVQQEIRRLSQQFEESLRKQGLDLKKYKEITKQDPSSLIPRFRAQAEELLKDSFVYAEIAKQEKIEVIENDYEIQYAKIAKIYNQPIDFIKQQVSKEQLQVELINNKVIDFLIANAKYTKDEKDAKDEMKDEKKK